MPEIVLRNLPFLAAGLWTTLSMAVWAALAGTALAAVVALVRHLRVPVLAPLCAAYVGFIQGTPVLVVLLLCYVAIPAWLGYRTSGYAACVAGFTVFLAAYCAEDMRAGLRAVPAALSEAGAALGLTRLQVLRLITVPLATRVATPALIGQYVRMIKYTSVASVIGVSELTGSALLVNARVFQPVTLLGSAAAAYFALCLSLSLAGRHIQRRFAGLLALLLLVAAPQAFAQGRRPEPWQLIAPVEATCLPPAEVFPGATTPEAVARALSGGENDYAVHYSGKSAATSDRAALRDRKGGGGEVVLVRGKDACLAALRQRLGQ